MRIPVAIVLTLAVGALPAVALAQETPGAEVRAAAQAVTSTDPIARVTITIDKIVVERLELDLAVDPENLTRILDMLPARAGAASED